MMILSTIALEDLKKAGITSHASSPRNISQAIAGTEYERIG